MDPAVSELVIIVVLVLLNAVFVAAEIAVVTVRRTRLQQLADEGNRAARRVQRLSTNPGRFLATIQVGITFIGFLAAAFAGAGIATRLADSIDDIEAVRVQAPVIALLAVTAVLSLFTIVVGELVPKQLALAHPERFAFILVRPIEFIGRLLTPVVWFLTAVTTFITRVLGVRDVDRDRMSTEELKLLVERGGEQGILEAEEEQMISAVMELGERRVHEVMVPRIDILGLPESATLDEVVDRLVEGGHSRIPVYTESIDNVVGILYAKDLLPYLKGSDHPPAIRSILRTPLFVPESLTVDDLLHEFQRRKVHIAIVLDEYGGTAGLVTIEDLIEEIVGEIQDEYDVEEPMLEMLSDHEARIDGRASIDDLAEAFDLKWGEEDAQEFDTVGGLVYHHVGGIPDVGDTVTVDGLTLTVESTDGRRVGKVLVIRRPSFGDEAAANADE